MDSSGSKSDDFRSVIDDLTVENKRLRQRLRKYEELHCSHLQGDKLFEVRCHGLPAHKKRELEETLRIFASRLEQSPGNPKPTSSPRPLSKTPVKKLSHVDSASFTSYCRPADSAYASMFPSGDTNVSRLHDELQCVRFKKLNKRDFDSSVYAVQEAPLVANPLRKLEKAKKKLVVRKLEGLFTGMGPASKACSQQQLQQEISQSARKAGSDRVLVEGVREARILPADAKSVADGTSDERAPVALQSKNHTSCSSAQFRTVDNCATDASSPEQRPTRPLDIDPNRVQVPIDNIDYIRHLGFPSSTGDPTFNGGVGEGWVYLNLLISMAQLHTINVTPAFVRKAVAEVSDRFELSRDGRKIRWKGGTEGSRMSSDAGSNGDQFNEKSFDGSAGRSPKRRRLGKDRFDSGSPKPERRLASSLKEMSQHPNQQPTDDGQTTKTMRTLLGQVQVHNMIDYTPLFWHANQSEEDERLVQSSNSATLFEKAGDDSSVTSATNASVNQKLEAAPLEPKYGDGLIIFYQGANFCTDLSGDLRSVSEGAAEFGQRTQDPLGSSNVTSRESLDDTDKIRTGKKFDTSPDSMDRENGCNGLAMADLCIPTVHASGIDTGCDGVVPLELEASGLGGVQPCDNFAIEVRVRHNHSFSAQGGAMARTHPREHRLLFNSTCQGITRMTPARVVVRGEIVSSVKTNLSPSSLPPPSYYLSLSTSETDDENDTGSDFNDSSNNDTSCSQTEVAQSAPSNLIQVYRAAVLDFHGT